MLIYYNYTYYITQNIITVCFNVRLKPERETRLLNSPRSNLFHSNPWSIILLPVPRSRDVNASFAPRLIFSSPSSLFLSLPLLLQRKEKRVGSRSEISFIMFTSFGYLCHRHTGLAPDLQPSDYRFGSFVGRCSFHSDQILPHGRSKLGKSTTCTTNEHGPSDTKREREAPLPVLLAESQSERINRITRVPACALEFKPARSLVALLLREIFFFSSYLHFRARGWTIFR